MDLSRFFQLIRSRQNFLGGQSVMPLSSTPSSGANSDEVWRECAERNLYGAATEDYTVKRQEPHGQTRH